jgi:hypothetical protein
MRTKPRPPRPRKHAPATVRPALSPREPATLASGRYGTAGRATAGTADNPTAGRELDGTGARLVTQTDRHGRARGRTVSANTNGRTVMRTGIGRRAEAGEFARESLTYVGAPHLTRTAPGVRLVAGMEAKQRLAGVFEGIRQPAMAERSVLHTTGAVAMHGRDPLWLADVAGE